GSSDPMVSEDLGRGPWHQRRDCSEQLGSQLFQVREPVAASAEDRYPEAASCKSLLLRQALVHGHEQIEAAVDGVEQRPVVDPGESQLLSGPDLMTGQLPPEARGHAAIEQDSHEAAPIRLPRPWRSART